MRYRRDRTPGAIYFFTLVTADRRAVFLREPAIDALRASLRHVAFRHPFATLAYVLLPDHYHALWRLPVGDDDFATRWRLIKHGVSHRLGAPVWQSRFWEHRIRDEADFERHADYVHYNPVKHGYVSDPACWPHSSLGHCIARGTYPAGWGQQARDISGAFGE